MMVRKVSLPHIYLQPYILWYNYLKVDARSMVQRCIPNGIIAIGINMSRDGGSWRLDENDDLYRPRICITGMSASPFELLLCDDIELLCVAFSPAGFSHLFGIPAQDLQGIVFSPQEIGCYEFTDLEDRLLEAPSIDECFRILDGFFLHKLFERGVAPDVFQRLKYSMKNMCLKRVNVRSMADDACLSERQFRRQFTEQVGCSPSEYIRYHRLMEARRQLLRGDASIEEIAYQCGYYDRSHMIKDFKSLAGGTPLEVLELHKKNIDFERLKD